MKERRMKRREKVRNNVFRLIQVEYHQFEVLA